MADENGLEIVLSPVQLAAILQGEDLGSSATIGNRLWGAATLVAGGLELVGASALILTPEPTMVTKVGGIALAVHGSDTTSTGLRQIWTGRAEATMTATAAAAAARGVGVEPRAAGSFGSMVDILVPLAVTAGLGAVRILSIRAGRISLVAEEAAGGHTIERHIARTEAQLRERLAAEARIPAATSFRSIAEAERVVSQALRANATAIRTWSRGVSRTPLRLTFDAERVIGAGVERSTGAFREMTSVRVVLRKTNVGDRVYFVLTSFPE